MTPERIAEIKTLRALCAGSKIGKALDDLLAEFSPPKPQRVKVLKGPLVKDGYTIHDRDGLAWEDEQVIASHNELARRVEVLRAEVEYSMSLYHEGSDFWKRFESALADTEDDA